MAIGYQTPNFGGLAQEVQDKYPLLNDIEKTEVEKLTTAGLSDMQAYKKVLDQKLAVQNKDKKVAMKNNMVLLASTNNDANQLKSVTSLDREDILVDKLKAYSPNNSTITDDRIISAAVIKYGQSNYTDYLNGKISMDQLFKSKPDTGSQGNIGTIAGVGLGIAALGIGTNKLLQPKSTVKPVIDEAKWKAPLPSKAVQKVEATILSDILAIAKKNVLVDKDAIAKSFATNFAPSQNFDEVLNQANLLLKDTPGTVINERNALITKYGATKTFGYEYLKDIKEYRTELANNPQVTEPELSKIDEIIANEEKFIKSKNDVLTAVDLETRKEQLNNDLKRFLGKDLTVLPKTDQIENQALNKIRAGAMKSVATLGEGTPDEGKITVLNREYKALLDIRDAAEVQAAKFKQIASPTVIKQTLSAIRKATASIWGVGYATSWMESWVLTKDEATLLKLEGYMKTANKYASKLPGTAGKVLQAIFYLGVANELAGGVGGAEASTPTPTFEQKYTAATQPATKGTTISPSKKTLVNPEAAMEGKQLGEGLPLTAYTIPILGEIIGGVDLASSAANWTETKIRKFINSFGKLSPKDQKALQEQLKKLITSGTGANQ